MSHNPVDNSFFVAKLRELYGAESTRLGATIPFQIGWSASCDSAAKRTGAASSGSAARREGAASGNSATRRKGSASGGAKVTPTGVWCGCSGGAAGGGSPTRRTDAVGGGSPTGRAGAAGGGSPTRRTDAGGGDSPPGRAGAAGSRTGAVCADPEVTHPVSERVADPARFKRLVGCVFSFRKVPRAEPYVTTRAGAVYLLRGDCRKPLVLSGGRRMTWATRFGRWLLALDKDRRGYLIRLSDLKQVMPEFEVPTKFRKLSLCGSRILAEDERGVNHFRLGAEWVATTLSGEITPVSSKYYLLQEKKRVVLVNTSVMSLRAQLHPTPGRVKQALPQPDWTLVVLDARNVLRTYDTLSGDMCDALSVPFDATLRPGLVVVGKVFSFKFNVVKGLIKIQK